MRSLERNTCLRFKKRGSERDYVDIQNEKGEGLVRNFNLHTNCDELLV